MKEITLLKRGFIFSYNSARPLIHIGRYILAYYRPKILYYVNRSVKGNGITKEMLEYGRENND